MKPIAEIVLSFDYLGFWHWLSQLKRTEKKDVWCQLNNTSVFSPSSYYSIAFPSLTHTQFSTIGINLWTEMLHFISHAMRFFYLSPLRLLAMKNLLPYYYVKLQTKLCTFPVLLLFFISLPTNPFAGNKSLPWGKCFLWQFHNSVNNLSELQFLAQLVSHTRLSSPFVCSVTSLKLKFFLSYR